MYQAKLGMINFERYLVYALILSMATYAIPSLRIHSEESIIPVGVVFLPLLFLLLLIRSLYTQKFTCNKVLLFSLFLLYFSIALSSLSSISLETERIVKLSIFMTLPILFTNILKDNKSLKVAIYPIIIVGIILGVYGFYGYFTGNVGEDTQKVWWWSYARYYGIHYLPSTRNSDIYYIAIPLFIVLSFLFFGNLRSFLIKIFLITASLMFFTGILLSFSRGAWISMVITIIVFLFVVWKKQGISTKRNSRLWLLFIVFLLLFLTITFKVLNYFNMYNYFLGKIISITSPEQASYYLEESISNEDRIEILKATFNIIISNPLGIGLDNLRYIYPSYGLYANHPENNYLHILAENGIFGFTGYLIFIFYPLIFLYKKVIKNNSNDYVRIGIFLVLVYLVTSYMFNVESFSFYNWLIHSIIWCSIPAIRNRDKNV